MTDAEFADFKQKTQAAMIGMTSCLVQIHTVIVVLNGEVQPNASSAVYKELSELSDRLQTLFTRVEAIQ